MNALLILIPISLVLAVVAVGVFFWAVNHAQFEDLNTPGVLPLLDDPPSEPQGQAKATEAGGQSVLSPDPSGQPGGWSESAL